MQDDLQQIIPKVRRFAFSLTGSEADSDDLLQSTIERMLVKTMPDDVDLLKWAFRICRNLWIDEFRSQKVRQKATENPELQQMQTVDGEQEMTNHMTLHQVNEAMNKLPDDQRSIIGLIALEGLSYKDVAKTLDIPVGTVMSRLSRARATLAGWFKKHDPEIVA